MAQHCHQHNNRNADKALGAASITARTENVQWCYPFADEGREARIKIL